MKDDHSRCFVVVRRDREDLEKIRMYVGCKANKMGLRAGSSNGKEHNQDETRVLVINHHWL